MKNEELPRGLRNCNPGNIRLSKDKWKGLRDVQTDGEFFQFVSMPYGYRAMLRTLQNYRKRHGCETIADFIRRWAPPSENNTISYIRFVCEKLGVPNMFVPNVENKAVMCMMVYAMAYFEHGVEPVMEDISIGWELLE